MRAHLLKLWLSIQASYWFWPSIMAVSAIVLASVTTIIDAEIDSDWPQEIPFFSANQPDGARALLATVAGSMITVTGITFSLTLLAVSHATSQFGPRLLTNFMKDRGNQFTLGVFIATFLYCLMILRTVRSPEEAQADAEAAGAFVPHLSILTALLLTILSVGVLIYFIHHIPESIRLSNVVSEVGRQLKSQIDELFPETIAEKRPEASSENIEHLSRDDAARIFSAGDGYLQAVDETGLLNAAKKHDLTLLLPCRPGNFVSEGMTLVFAWPAEAVTDELRRNFEFMFALGAHRTSNQNTLFLVDQLVEVASRALSPGVNDPMTAITCFDWLQSALISLGKRNPPSKYRVDEEGRLRIVAEPVSYEEFCSAIFDQLRPYVARDRNAALHMMKMIVNVRHSIECEEIESLLNEHTQRLRDAAESAGLANCDLEELCEVSQAESVIHLINGNGQRK